MSSFYAFYVKANGKATLDAMSKGFDQLKVEQYRDFIGIQLPGAPKKTPEDWLSHLSKEFTTDVFWLSFESAMDCFEFHHYQSGQHVRSLVYGMQEERMWERADGTPESWEREFLFHPKNMEYELEDAEEEELKETIQRVYRDAKIEVGQIVPSISSKMTADAIGHHYGFPHYASNDELNLSTEQKICVRCKKPVTVHASEYEVFERMHWLCFHLEFEHKGDPDDPCGDPSCPWWQIEVFRHALTEAGHDPKTVLEKAIGERWKL